VIRSLAGEMPNDYGRDAMRQARAIRSAAFAVLILLALSIGGTAADVYPIEILLTTTSDWTDVFVSGATLVVHDQKTLQGADAPGLRIAALSTLSVGKASYEETQVSIRFDAYLTDVTDWLSIKITKGHIGRTTVTLYAPGDDEPLASYQHVGISASSDPANPRTFSTPASQVTPLLSPLNLDTPTSSTFGQHVLAFYYPWYGTPDGPSGEWVHWNPNRAHHDSAHDPAYGLYDSNDPETVRRHIREAKSAGIDGFIASWWGRHGFEDRAFDVLAQVAAEEDYLITIYYEIADTPLDIVIDLTYFLNRHGDNTALLRVDDKPVVFFYVRVTSKFSLPQWESVFDRLAGRNLPIFALADGLSAEFLEAFDGIHTYNPVGLSLQEASTQYTAASLLARAQDQLFAATVIPGYDEAYKNPTFTYLDREDGETYRSFWAVARESLAHWVLITSYNEWHEGSEIEPSLEYGTTYLQITSEQAWAWKHGEPVQASEPDRDGDGVPDEDDLCPDFPGSPASDGC